MSIREHLLRGNESGTLLETVNALWMSLEDRSAVTSELVALHNEGLVDAVAAFEPLRDTSPAGTDFFLTRHVFEQALPDLDSPVPAVMHCVLRLYDAAGRDLAAGTVVESFIHYCERDASRPREALAEIEASPDVFARLLPGTLVAGSRVDTASFLAEAIRLCEADHIELRRHAVFSLGKLEWPEGGEAADSALATLERAAKAETDGQILAGVVTSAFALVKQHGALEPHVVAVIATALSKGDENTIHSGSEVLGFRTGELTATLLDTLFVHLPRVRSTDKGTLDNIDFGLSHLLESSDPERGIELLETLLLRRPDELTMEVFDSAGRAILTNRALINKVATRWFLRGDRALCEAVSTIIASGVIGDLPLEIDAAELKLADSSHIIFTARKAIGYLFMEPISAAAFLISLMRSTADQEVLTALGVLLFDPLLLNYPGKARDYVARQLGQESGQVKATVGEAFARLDDYLEDLKSVGRLPALHPSTAHRDAYERHFSRQMEESWKAAEANSGLLSLVSKSVVLFGRTSITYVRGLDEQPRRMESPMQTHETEMELPRILRLDPLGLDFKLRVFRVEQITA